MTADPQNQQSALQGNDVGGNLTIGSITQTINYNQVIQEAKRTGSPINLPQTNVTFFAGRDEDLKKVHELLQQNQRVAVSAFLKGMGGVGKSELALQYALRHLLSDYGGGICWLRGNEGTLPTQLQDFVQMQLGETMPDGLDSGERLVGYCWRRLSERLEGKMLVVLDNVKSSDDVNPFLPPQNGKFRVLVTTRFGLGNAMQQYTLDVLVLAAAVDLLKSFLPETDLRRGSDAEIEKVCEWLGRLPLAIELVGRYLARKPDLSIAKMQERLDAKKLQQEALTDTQRRALAEMTAKLNVIAAFDLSWQDLSEGAQRLACLLSLFALAPIHWQWVMDAMGDVDEEDLEACRDDELLNLHLLERSQHGLYELHQLLREYFQFQLQQRPEWQVLRQQVAVSLLNISKGIGQTITLDQVKEVASAIPHFELLGHEMLDDILNPEEDVVWAFCGIARFYESQGLYASAVIPSQNCLRETESRSGLDHLSVATSLNNLAELYRAQGKYNEAEPLYLRSLSILERQLGADYPSVATSLNNLAELYRAQGKYNEAEPLYLRSLDIRERQLGAEHPDVAASLNNLALLYESQGKYSEAEPLYLRSLSIWGRQLGADHPNVATSLNNLALVYDSQGKYSEAEPLYLRSLSIWERQLGADHPHVAQSLNNLAGLYQAQEKYSEAEPLYVRSLEISERQLGADHPYVASNLLNLAALYHNTQRHPQALQSIQHAIQIYEQKLGTEHPDTQNAIGWLQTIRDAV
ncbi:kinesin light chain [Pseudanabaena sp. lw0831]|uniref:tetratricopeptide repeat protein n=1 Tax=Pseudanabaena sp. lw0831 TaxID=1357935 RepID=UPI001915FFDA|nr:tetratricopeptide repeat protein [Pseudanabaena sp. lw0831]GBO56164.1 kinesin light chain [Pseudanabaena sp. lw0831]